jgi:hypothetical protein
MFCSIRTVCTVYGAVRSLYGSDKPYTLNAGLQINAATEAIKAKERLSARRAPWLAAARAGGASVSWYGGRDCGLAVATSTMSRPIARASDTKTDDMRRETSAITPFARLQMRSFHFWEGYGNVETAAMVRRYPLPPRCGMADTAITHARSPLGLLELSCEMCGHMTRPPSLPTGGLSVCGGQKGRRGSWRSRAASLSPDCWFYRPSALRGHGGCGERRPMVPS